MRKGHTEGEWVWEGCNLIAKSKNIRDITVIKDGYVDNDDDTSLIAAAPDLLTALEAVKLRIHFIGLPSEPMNEDGPDWSKEITLLEAALAKTKKG